MFKHPPILAGLLLGSLILVASAAAALHQQGPKLVGTGGVGYQAQGTSVALSADGKTALVGGYLDDNYVGATWVFARKGRLWFQEGPKLVGTGGVGYQAQGSYVALSADGNTALVGGYMDGNLTGAAWVFTRTRGVWSQQGSKLVGGGASLPADQGVSVALSGDGNTAVVGGPLDGNEVGAAWVFTRSAGAWSQQGSKLIGAAAVGGTHQGRSVAVSGDGNIVVVGGPSDNSGIGAAWVYTRSGGVWSQQGPKLVGSGSVGPSSQGASVSLSADGNTAFVGGPLDNYGAGATWVFTRSGDVWTQQGSKLVGTSRSKSGQQGYSVAVSGDGSTAVVGGDEDNFGTGAAWVFSRSSDTWSQQGDKLVGADGSSSSHQGSSAAISYDGSTAIVGGFGDEAETGAAWVYAPGRGPAPQDLARAWNTDGISGNATLSLRATPSASAGRFSLVFEIPRLASAQLEIYDLAGRRVETLLGGSVLEGRHTAVWNGTSHHGAPVADGVYFARLTAAGASRTTRLVVMK